MRYKVRAFDGNQELVIAKQDSGLFLDAYL